MTYQLFVLLALIQLGMSAPSPPVGEMKAAAAVFDDAEARDLYNLAAAAYSEDGEAMVQCMTRAYPSDDYKLISKSQHVCDSLGNKCTFYHVNSQKLNKVLFIFRGTASDLQLKAEMSISVEPPVDFYGMGLVNKYFKHAHDTLWDTIKQWATVKDYKYSEFTFTGHSLGGALASLAAARIVSEGIQIGEKVRVVTYGEPRVGNVVYANNFDKSIPYSFRVVNRLDLVPHLRSCATVTDYEGSPKPCDPNNTNKFYHHGTEIWYRDGMSPFSAYSICNGTPKNEDMACSDGQVIDFHNTTDHFTYYDVANTMTYGKSGCMDV